MFIILELIVEFEINILNIHCIISCKYNKLKKALLAKIIKRFILNPKKQYARN